MIISKSTLRQKLQKYVQRPSFILAVEEDIEMKSNPESEQVQTDVSAMDVVQAEIIVDLQGKLQDQRIIFDDDQDIDMESNSEQGEELLMMNMEHDEKRLMPIEQNEIQDMLIDDDYEELAMIAAAEEEVKQLTEDLIEKDPQLFDVD